MAVTLSRDSYHCFRRSAPHIIGTRTSVIISAFEVREALLTRGFRGGGMNRFNPGCSHKMGDCL